MPTLPKSKHPLTSPAASASACCLRPTPLPVHPALSRLTRHPRPAPMPEAHRIRPGQVRHRDRHTHRDQPVQLTAQHTTGPPASHRPVHPPAHTHWGMPPDPAQTRPCPAPARASSGQALHRLIHLTAHPATGPARHWPAPTDPAHPPTHPTASSPAQRPLTRPPAQRCVQHPPGLLPALTHRLPRTSSILRPRHGFPRPLSSPPHPDHSPSGRTSLYCCCIVHRAPHHEHRPLAPRLASWPPRELVVEPL